MREQCLKLTLACLSYDFFGTSSDETTEDVGTVQVCVCVCVCVCVFVCVCVCCVAGSLVREG